jgi:hypothetical protein
VRKSQGFDVVIDDTQPLCTSCLEAKTYRDFYNSAIYQEWFASIPSGMTMEENMEWTKSNPPPSMGSETPSEQTS